MRRLAYIAVDPNSSNNVLFMTAGDKGLTLGFDDQHKIENVDYYRNLDLRKVDFLIEIEEGERVFRTDLGGFFVSDSIGNLGGRMIPDGGLTYLHNKALFTEALIGPNHPADIDDLYVRVLSIPKRIIYAQGRLDANIFDYPPEIVKAIKALREEMQGYCNTYGVVYNHDNFDAAASQVAININAQIIR